MSQTLRLSSPEFLAEYVRESELKSFFEKRLAAPPDHMAMLIRNGQIVDTFKGAHFSVGGLLNKLREFVVGSSNIQILLADLKPFSIQTVFQGISKDKVAIAARATFELQVNPDDPKNVMGLVNNSGYATRDEILKRLEPHLSARVVEAEVQQVNSDEVRGNLGMQDRIQAEMMGEVQRVAGDLGLIVRAVSLEWALTATELDHLTRSELEREQRKMDEQLDYLKRQIGRQHDAQKFEIQLDVDMQTFKAMSQSELEHLALHQEIRFLDARLEAERRQQLDALHHEAMVLRNERVVKFENRLAEASHLIDAAKLRRDLSKIDHEIGFLDLQHDIQLKELKLEFDRKSQIQAQDLDDRKTKIELANEATANQNQTSHVANLSDIEIKANQAAIDAKIALLEAQTQAEIDGRKAEGDMQTRQLEAASHLSPEQILAVKAGFSDAVANILVEQAKANAKGHDDVMSVMREMIARANEAQVSSEQQARDMFRSAMDGVSGVAQGVQTRQAGSGSCAATHSETVVCPNPICRKVVSALDNFCTQCGHRFRT